MQLLFYLACKSVKSPACHTPAYELRAYNHEYTTLKNWLLISDLSNRQFPLKLLCIEWIYMYEMKILYSQKIYKPEHSYHNQMELSFSSTLLLFMLARCHSFDVNWRKYFFVSSKNKKSQESPFTFHLNIHLSSLTLKKFHFLIFKSTFLIFN